MDHIQVKCVYPFKWLPDGGDTTDPGCRVLEGGRFLPLLLLFEMVEVLITELVELFAIDDAVVMFIVETLNDVPHLDTSFFGSITERKTSPGIDSIVKPDDNYMEIYQKDSHRYRSK